MWCGHTWMSPWQLCTYLFESLLHWDLVDFGRMLTIKTTAISFQTYRMTERRWGLHMHTYFLRCSRYWTSCWFSQTRGTSSVQQSCSQLNHVKTCLQSKTGDRNCDRFMHVTSEGSEECMSSKDFLGKKLIRIGYKFNHGHLHYHTVYKCLPNPIIYTLLKEHMTVHQIPGGSLHLSLSLITLYMYVCILDSCVWFHSPLFSPLEKCTFSVHSPLYTGKDLVQVGALGCPPKIFW